MSRFNLREYLLKSALNCNINMIANLPAFSLLTSTVLVLLIVTPSLLQQYVANKLQTLTPSTGRTTCSTKVWTRGSIEYAIRPIIVMLTIRNILYTSTSSTP